MGIATLGTATEYMSEKNHLDSGSLGFPFMAAALAFIALGIWLVASENSPMRKWSRGNRLRQALFIMILWPTFGLSALLIFR